MGEWLQNVNDFHSIGVISDEQRHELLKGTGLERDIYKKYRHRWGKIEKIPD